MTKDYDPNEEYNFPQEEQAQDDLAMPEAQAESVAEYVEEDEAIEKPASKSFLNKLPMQNKRLWMVIGAVLIGIIAITVFNHGRENTTLDPSVNQKTSAQQSQEQVLAMKQRLNMQTEQMQQAAEQMQNQFGGVKQQTENNQAALSQMQNQMQQMQNAMNQIASTESQLNNQLQQINSKVDTMSHKTATKPTVEKKKPVAKPKPKVYSLQAIDAGGDLAWIQDQNGHNLTVRVGDQIPGDKGQLVAQIDSVNGQIITNLGKTIKYAA